MAHTTLWNTRVYHITTTSLLERAGVRPLIASSCFAVLLHDPGKGVRVRVRAKQSKRTCFLEVSECQLGGQVGVHVG